MVTVTVNNRKATAVPLSDVTVGAVGIPVNFHFSEDWDGLSKIAVFKVNDAAVEMAVLMDSTTVPAEVLTDAYETLWIGIYGSNAQGTVVIPTIWANAGPIQPGTTLETIDPSEPTPSWVAQVQAAAEEALTIANEIKDDAESGAFDGEDGTGGVSPTVAVTEITGGHQITITDASGSHVFAVMDGADGQNGSDGQPGTDGVNGQDGSDGQDGQDGVSPTISVTDIDGGHKVTITDATGTTSFDVLNGQDGSTGPQGETGPAGATGAAGRGIQAFYPNGTSTAGDVTYDEYLMEFTDDTTFTLLVRRGAKGDKGDTGATGQDGNDGITPTVTVTEITGGHNVAFDYGSGDSRNKNFDVMDGADLSEDVDELKNAANDLALNKAPVITDTASGAIASFPDGADGLPLKKLVAQIDPVQDLHGYDSPWPAGGGKNLIPSTVDILKSINVRGTWAGNAYTISGVTFTVNDDGTITINGTATVNIFFDFVSNLSPIPISAGSYILHGTGSEDINVSVGKNGAYWGAATTSNVSLTADSDSTFTAYSYISSGKTFSNFILKPMLEKGTSASAWSPYENLCPISGWTGLEGKRTGKNLCGDVTVPQTASNANRIVNPVYLKAGQYTFSFSGRSAVTAIYIRKGENITFAGDAYAQKYNSNVFTFTADEDGYYYVQLYRGGATPTWEDEPITHAWLELGSTASAYEPYSAESLSVSWQDTAGTVYGGTMTVNEDGSGVLTATHKYYENAGTGAWGEVATDGARYYIGGVSTDAKNSSTNGWCNIGNLVSNFTSNGVFVGSNGRINLCGTLHSAFASVDDLKTYLNSNPLQVAYELAEPPTYHFDNLTQLSTVYGINNIWVDTGDTSVEYRADTKLYLEKLTAPTEDDMIANANIAANKFFMVGNNLYFSTAAIAQGATIVPGTNCTLTNLADALNTLNS